MDDILCIQNQFENELGNHMWDPPSKFSSKPKKVPALCCSRFLYECPNQIQYMANDKTLVKGPFIKACGEFNYCLNET